MLLDYDRQGYLPTAKDLPDSDDTPVDNQLQHIIPVLLESVLALIWSGRTDWHFGVDMGIYYDPGQPAVVPDAFLSVGVPRVIDEGLRLSYVLWEERQLPLIVIEIVSQTRRKEYTEKKDFYRRLGIPYYVIYNPQRKRKPKLEVYRLLENQYELLAGEPVWIEEIGLGIGREMGTYQGVEREWLYWYDGENNRYPTAEELARSARQRCQELEQRLRDLGIEP